MIALKHLTKILKLLKNNVTFCIPKYCDLDVGFGIVEWVAFLFLLLYYTMNSTHINQCFFEDNFNQFYNTCSGYKQSMLQRALLSHNDLKKHHYRNVQLDESQMKAILYGDNLQSMSVTRLWNDADSVKARHAFDELDGTLQRDIVFKLVWSRHVFNDITHELDHDLSTTTISQFFIPSVRKWYNSQSEGTQYCFLEGIYRNPFTIMEAMMIRSSTNNCACCKNNDLFARLFIRDYDPHCPQYSKLQKINKKVLKQLRDISADDKNVYYDSFFDIFDEYNVFISPDDKIK